jgi:hypothetical protein
LILEQAAAPEALSARAPDPSEPSGAENRIAMKAPATKSENTVLIEKPGKQSQ